MARIDWPFKRMREGEKLVIWNMPPVRVAAAAHTWARQAGAKMATRTVREDGRTGVEVELVLAPVPREGRAAWPFKDLQPGEKTVFTCDSQSEAIRAMMAMRYFSRYHGVSFKHKLVKQDDGTVLFLVKRLDDGQH